MKQLNRVSSELSEFLKSPGKLCSNQMKAWLLILALFCQLPLFAYGEVVLYSDSTPYHLGDNDGYPCDPQAPNGTSLSFQFNIQEQVSSVNLSFKTNYVNDPNPVYVNGSLVGTTVGYNRDCSYSVEFSKNIDDYVVSGNNTVQIVANCSATNCDDFYVNYILVTAVETPPEYEILSLTTSV